MKKGGIISFDLYTGSKERVDISSFFPIAELHPIRSNKPLFDTIERKHYPKLDLSLPNGISLEEFRTFQTLDVGPDHLAYERGLSRSPAGARRGSIVDVCPPLSLPYGAIDVRGEPILSERKYGDIYKRSLPWGLHARRITRDTRRFLRKKRKPIVLSLILFFSLTVPVLLYTKSLIEHAYEDLIELKGAKDVHEIATIIKGSRDNFERANLLFFPFRIIPGENMQIARIALDGGLRLSRGLDHIFAQMDGSSSGSIISRKIVPTDSLFRPIATDIRPLAHLGITEPTKWLRKNRESVLYLKESLETAGTLYSQAENISHPRSEEIAHIGRGLTKMSQLLEKYLTHEGDILTLLGENTPERYIVFNQNRDEIRANGGFPGSIITFTVFQGNVEDYRVDDVYYYDWNLYPFKEIPPPGLALISGNYGLRDVNYYPDFHETLEKANTFIERSGDPTVTVGVAVHQGILEDILKVVGPVSLSGVTEPFRSDNFSLLMSVLVESRYNEETSAKDILRKFVDAFAKQINEKRAYEEVIDILEKSFHDGEILFASRNDTIDRFFDTFRKPLPWENTEKILQSREPISSVLSGASRVLSGQTMSITGDSFEGQNWVYPLLTSLSGNKSDRLIERNYQGLTEKLGSCIMSNKLTFTHKHTYNRVIEEQIRKYISMIGIRDTKRIDALLDIQGRGKNISYIRVLVPKNATLTGSTAGITVNDTPYAREFVFTLETPKSSTASKVIRYTLDIPGCSKEKTPILWYRQPGLQKTTIQTQ